MTKIAPENFVFIDECGVNTNLVRSHARAPSGTRAAARRPANRGKNVTVIGGVCLDSGVVATRTYLGAMNATRFIDWLNAYLLPAVGTERVIVLDNLRVHHVAPVRELIEQAGCRLVYLPPYSPDLNPIEMVWSKLKAYLRKRAERSTQRVRRAVHWGLRTVRHTDVAGWFDHSGYT